MSAILKQLTARLMESSMLSMSPVSYIAEVLNQYACGQITGAQLITAYAQRTQRAFFYLSHMPQEDIAENKRLFKNEFTLANSITDAIQGTNSPAGQGGNECFDALLEKCIEEYLSSSDQNQTE